MGLTFLGTVNVLGAYFAAQGASGNESDRLRVIGYQLGQIVDTTEWFYDIDESPSWFNINLHSVDRVVIESDPNVSWYGMDNFTYEAIIPLPATAWLFLSAVCCLIGFKRKPS